MEQIDDLAMPFLLTSAFQGLVDAVHADLADAGFPDVRASHGFAMQAIGSGCSGVELAARLGVTKQAAAKTVQAMEAMGLVARTASRTDRRERAVVPTARGREMVTLASEGFRRHVAAWRERAGDAAVDTTLATLQTAPRPRRGPADVGGQRR